MENKRYQVLQIYRPLISNRQTQHFGENRACVDSKGRITGTIKTCPTGTIPFYPSIGMKGHNGADFGAFLGEDIYHAATFSGWWRADHDSAGGLGVDVVSDEPLFFPFPIPTELINTAVPHNQDGIQGFTHHVKMRYWHLSKQLGYDKKPVTTGMVIGLAGNTGASSGTHLHFAPKWCLPNGDGVGNANGYVGAFDPEMFANFNITALEYAQATHQEPPALSQKETKDMLEQLSMIRICLLALQKFIHKL